MKAAKPIRTAGDLSWWVGAPGLESDPTRAAARLQARERLGRELADMGVDTRHFQTWLGEQLRDYHEQCFIAANLASLDDEQQFVRAFARQVCEVRDRFPLQLPIRAHAALPALALRSGIDWAELQRRLRDDLVTFAALLQAIDRRLRASTAKRGRKPKTAVDLLLARVIAELRTTPKMKAAVARHMALRILQVEGIVAPSPDQREPERAAARAARRVQK